MGVHRIRSGSVGRPFTNGNPGGGRPKGAQNKATMEIKEFARNFLMSDRYRRTLERRILAGTAPQIEVLLHHYAFGKPTDKYVEPAPPVRSEAKLLMSRMTKEEIREMVDLARRMRVIAPSLVSSSGRPGSSRVLAKWRIPSVDRAAWGSDRPLLPHQQPHHLRASRGC
jgi:hypothetical protein